MVHFYNGLILAILYVGVLFRKKKKVHVPMMISCFCLDLISVFYLEWNRNVLLEALTDFG